MSENNLRRRWSNPPKFPSLPLFTRSPGRINYLAPDKVPKWVRDNLERVLGEDTFSEEYVEFVKERVDVRNLFLDATSDDAEREAAESSDRLAVRFRAFCLRREVPLVLHEILWTAITASPPLHPLEVVPAHFATTAKRDGKAVHWPRHALLGWLGRSSTDRHTGGTLTSVEHDDAPFGVLVFDAVQATREELYAAIDRIAFSKKGPPGLERLRALNAVEAIFNAQVLDDETLEGVTVSRSELYDSWATYWRTGKRSSVLVQAVQEVVRHRHRTRPTETVVRRALKEWREQRKRVIEGSERSQ